MAHEEFFNMIKQEHQMVIKLLDELIKKPPSEGAQTFQQLKSALIPHLEAEEKTWYPMLMKNASTKQIAMLALEEHHAAEMLFRELEQAPRDESWTAKIMVFKDVVGKHVQDEETQAMSLSHEAFSKSEMDQIMTSFQREKETIKSGIR